jgi:aminopeptidase YwaD
MFTRWAMVPVVLSSLFQPLHAQEDPRPVPQELRRVATAVRAQFSGDRALELVTFVERFWRVPGNTGYNASITQVAGILERAGYVLEARAQPQDRLVYRIERRPMDRPTWEPLDASLTIVGQPAPLLRFSSNRNMMAMNSFSTPAGGVTAEVVNVGAGRPEDWQGKEVRGKIVLGDLNIGRLFREAVVNRGAAGVLSYSLPPYVKPEVNRTSIQFSGIPLDTARSGWGILLSFAAREALRAALAQGPVSVQVETRSRSYPAEELTLVAEVRGSEAPEERFVFSAHVQEPGANDNASGVATLAEVARTVAEMTRSGELVPRRTITFLWGDEIRATTRFLQENPGRAEGVRWGMSLDMVGENTEITGGTFLIEKMPDPSAVWTRGEDRHSEWGGQPLKVDQLTPHYYNDFVLNRALDQAAVTGWVVRTNPFEGGSDHTPFLDAGKPGLLLWHFTDQFYHTDNDRLDKVSPLTMANVGVTATVIATVLASADSLTARLVVDETERAALSRLAAEFELSRKAITNGGKLEQEILILTTWTEWYVNAIRSVRTLEIGGPAGGTTTAIEAAVTAVEGAGLNYVARLR